MTKLAYIQDVLDHGYVSLVDSMGSDRRIAEAAALTRQVVVKDEGHVRRLITSLLFSRHMTPFERAVFEFKIYAPEIVWRQLMTYRAWRRIRQSLRHTEAADFYVPDDWRMKRLPAGGQDELQLARYKKTLSGAKAEYDKVLAQGIPKELARLFLPFLSVYTVGWCQVDANNLMHFFDQRLAPGAQHETRLYAEAMFEIFESVLPVTAAAYKELRGIK